MKTAFEKAKWFRESEYGFFFHFLNKGSKDLSPASGEGSQRTPFPPKEWNELVDSFNVKKIARQLHELHAGFAWLTIGQNNGYYCCPNQAYDEYLGRGGDTSKCSKRDLVSDFADALAEYGIRLLVYTTCQAPGYDHEAMKALESIPPWNCNANCGNYEEVKYLAGSDPRLKNFLHKWSKIHAEWSARWGTKVNGWWVDGSEFAKEIYDFKDEPNGVSFAAVLRAGNPDSLIAFNPGVVYPPRRNYPGSPEDITAGEINDPVQGLLTSPIVDGLQYHVLTFVGPAWGGRPLRYSGREIAEITRTIADNGGVVSWDIPFSTVGIEDNVFVTLKDFADEYQKSRKAFPRTQISWKMPQFIDGTLQPGALTLKTDKESIFTVDWHGRKQTIKAASAEIPLDGSKEGGTVKITCNGFERAIPITVYRKLKLKPEWSEPRTVPSIGSYRFALGNKKLKIHGELNESEPCVGDCPWANSCLELFLSTDRKHYRQYIFSHNGTVTEYASNVLLPVPGGICHTKYADGKMTLDCELTLADEFTDGKFYFDMCQSLNDHGKKVYGTVFGPNRNFYSAEIEL